MISFGNDESLPDGWKWIKAGDYIDVRDGTHDSPRAIDAGIPLVTSKNLVNGEIDFSTCSYISQEDHDAISKRSSVNDGDILYAMIGTIGNPVVVNKSREFSIKNVALFKFNKGGIHNRFVYHFLNSELTKQQFAKNSRGGTQKFVSLGNIRALEIPLPFPDDPEKSLKEQQRIAAILDKADGIRRKRQQAIELADEFLRSVFLDMFGDPVTNPKGWEVRPLKEVASLINGDRSSNYPSGSDLIDSGILFLNTKNIVNNSLKLDDVNYISQEKFDSLGGGKLCREDIVITLRGTLANCAIFESEFATGFINAQLMIIRPSQELNNKFMHALLTSSPMYRYFQSLGRGAAVPQLTGAQMKEIAIFMPPLELQNKFVAMTEVIFHLIEKNNAQVDASLLESLSQKAFKGEL